jgi:CDP-4-dehydro-6-deoxyglucose reductase, E3
MARIRYREQDFTLLENESVLDGLLRNGFPVAHSCRAGVCGSCLMRTAAGPVPSRAQSGMKDSWKAQGYFYSCSCIPESDIDVSDIGVDVRVGAAIASLRLLSGDVLQANLQTDVPVAFRAGQYITIVRGNVARSYSIASLPEQSELELHVRKIPGGRMSGWFHDEAQAGDRVSIIGPSGECFYVSGREDQPLLLAGTGTGLAPLYGVVRDALKSGHRGPIHLFHGALHKGGLYLVDVLRQLAREHPQLEYIPAILKGDEADGCAIGPIDSVILDRIPILAGWRGFVCGDPVLVQMLKKKFFLSGMASRDIFADAFLPASPN